MQNFNTGFNNSNNSHDVFLLNFHLYGLKNIIEINKDIEKLNFNKTKIMKNYSIIYYEKIYILSIKNRVK